MIPTTTGSAQSERLYHVPLRTLVGNEKASSVKAIDGIVPKAGINEICKVNYGREMKKPGLHRYPCRTSKQGKPQKKPETLSFKWGQE